MSTNTNFDKEEKQISEAIERLARLIIDKTLSMDKEEFEPSTALASYLSVISVRVFSEKSMGRCSLADLAAIVPSLWKSLEKGILSLTSVDPESINLARKKLADAFVEMSEESIENEKCESIIH